MLNYCVLLLAIFAVVTSSYDFKDVDFNNYLFEEFQDVLNEDKTTAISLRQRREVEANTGTAETAVESSKKECTRRDWMKDFQCCTGDKFDTKQHEAYMEAKKQCYVELRGINGDDSFDPFNCEKMQKLKRQMYCISECVAKKFNFLEEDGSLKRDVLLAQVRAIVSDIAWNQEAAERIVDKCLAEVKEKREAKTKESPASTEANRGCNQCPMEFHYCLWREISNGCPAEFRVETPKCKRLRERLAKGDNSQVHYFHFLHARQHEE